MNLSLGNAGLQTSAKKLNPQTIEARKKKKTKGKSKAKDSAKQPVDKAEISDAKASESKEAAAASTSPIEGAEEIPGMFKLYKKDEKYWFSIKPDQLNKPFFFSANTSKSLGEKRLVGSEMGESFLAEFRKTGDRVQLVALHTENFATPDTPQEKFVEEGFADSLISSSPMEEGSDPEKEILVSANSLLFKDIPAYQARLGWAYDTQFGMDPSNTHFTQVDNTDDQTSFGVQAHYVASPAADKLPSTAPMANSVLPEFRYNFLKLPEDPMTPRLADERIGHFVTTRKDYTGDEGDGIVRYVNRWRLEKKDPDAPMSEPVKPITYWVANDVPEEYREAVKNGVLEWNKAFEAIGFKNAIEVKQQKASDKFDPLDARHASVRWYTAADVGSAVGPSHVDPRTGEILDADIRMADIFGRSAKRFLMDNAPETKSHAAEHAHEHGHIHGAHGHEHCEYQAHAGMEAAFANDLMAARGDAEASKELAQAYVKDVVMHEVGHTLGLRHNFKGSTIHTPEELTNAEFTKENGLGSSVMDYHPFNLAGPGEEQGEYVMSTLGAYDYLAVKYAYAPIDPALESETLNDIAKLTTTEPDLAYETDEAADDMDPEVSRFDLGSDPLEFSAKTITLARELWDRAQNQELPEDTSYKELTRAFSSGLRKMGQASRLATRYVGGVSIRRDRAGTGNPIYKPVPAEKQRAALNQIVDNMFQPDSFKFKPEFVSRLAKERFGNWGDQNIHVGQMVTNTQARALKDLLSAERAQRLIDNPEKMAEGEDKFTLGEMYETVQNNIWSELGSGSDISQGRRDLQRVYTEMATEIISGEAEVPGEARSLMRYLGGRLQGQIDGALKGNLSLENRAHLEDIRHQLDKALNPGE